MRPSVLSAVALLLCSCTKTSERTGATGADSGIVADSATAAPALASTKKGTNGEQAADGSRESASSGQSSSALQGSAASKKAASRAPADTRCGIKGNPVLTTLGVGNLSIGRTVTTIKGTCRVIRDIEELTSEGTLDQVLTVVIGGDVYRATVVNGLVWRVSVRTPRVATRDGLRVGTPLSRVAALKGVKIAEGEDGLYLLADSHCGLSFRFSIQVRWPTGRPWTMEELIRRYGNRPVDRILVTRCVRSA